MKLEDTQTNLLSGHYQPEERLKEAELAEKYSVSKTPVREALRYLESLGFVEIVPHTMARVKKMNQKEVEDLYTIQSVLEGLAAREALDHLNKADHEKMETFIGLLEKYSFEKNSYEYEKANIKFHGIFWQACNNSKLTELINNIYEQLQKFRSITRRYPERFKDLVADHRKIFEAVVQRDTAKVDHLFRRHVEKQKKYIVDILKKENHL
jgi:DNA-binding GntR family transcriptional regulator